MKEHSFSTSGNPQDVLSAISERHKLEPIGEPSLQNAIDMARSTMRSVRSSYTNPVTGLSYRRSHLPTHSSREILIIFGSLTTCDPGNIHETLETCVKTKTKVSIVALAAEMKICRELCEKTGGTPSVFFLFLTSVI
jgi:transcription initiation factor TFIIH subunit 2